jgi:putative methyltransferase (TIGR04325 family)
MTPKLRQLAKRCLPPSLVRWLRGRPPYVWDGIYARFEDIPEAWSHYDDASRVHQMRTQAAELLRNIRAGQRVGLWHEALGMLASTVAAAAAGRGVRVLDFGGGVGTGFLHLLQSLPRDAALQYAIVELEHMAAAGREVFRTEPRISFLDAIPDTGARFDIVYLNGVLPYVDDYRALLTRLCGLQSTYILLARLAAGAFPTFVTRQLNFPGQVLPYRFISFPELVALLHDNGYRLAFDGVGDTEYDQSNFPATHRVGRMRNALFARIDRMPAGSQA